MNKKVECWILMSISQAHKKKGIEIKQLFEQRPDYIPDDLTKFFKLLLDLESKGLIEFNKEMSSPYYKITGKGEKCLERYMKSAEIKDVFNAPG